MSGTAGNVLARLLIITVLLLPLLLTGPSSPTAEASSFSPSGEWQGEVRLAATVSPDPWGRAATLVCLWTTASSLPVDKSEKNSQGKG